MRRQHDEKGGLVLGGVMKKLVCASRSLIAVPSAKFFSFSLRRMRTRSIESYESSLFTSALINTCRSHVLTADANAIKSQIYLVSFRTV
jgi:hypothetical protein